MANEQIGEARLYIDGALTDAAGARTYDNINPATEAVLGVTADASLEDAEQAVAAARRAFDETDWPTDHKGRLKILREFAAAIEAAADSTLRPQIIAEVGQPDMVTRGPGCDDPVAHLSWVLDTMDAFDWQRELPQVTTQQGILATGNTVVLKPAPDTPWTATALGKIATEVGLPPGVFNVVAAKDPAEVGEFLCRDPRVDMVSFTGSTVVGKRIMAMASDTVKKVFLELGGKSALILLDDANLDMALLSSLGVCYHAGQGCAITTRMLVHRSLYDKAVEQLAPIFQGMPYGDPTDPQYMMGPAINRKQYDKILGMIADGVSEGARVVAGGGAGEMDKGFFIQPTLLADVHNDMRIARNEIFGPVLVMIPFEDDEDAIRIANDSDFGLSGAIHSGDVNRALAMARRIRTGTLMINGGGYYGPDAPFGGYKQSGIGREMGIEGLLEYLEVKTVGVPA